MKSPRSRACHRAFVSGSSATTFPCRACFQEPPACLRRRSDAAACPRSSRPPSSDRVAQFQPAGLCLREAPAFIAGGGLGAIATAGFCGGRCCSVCAAERQRLRSPWQQKRRRSGGNTTTWGRLLKRGSYRLRRLGGANESASFRCPRFERNAATRASARRSSPAAPYAFFGERRIERFYIECAVRFQLATFHIVHVLEALRESPRSSSSWLSDSRSRAFRSIWPSRISTAARPPMRVNRGDRKEPGPPAN